MSRKHAIIIGVIFIVLLAGGGLAVLRSGLGRNADCRYFWSGEDCWDCRDGQWVKHGNPSASVPKAACGKPAPENKGDVVVASPKPNDFIVSPAVIEGEARGTWFFEAVFPVRLVDGGGTELARGQARATADWMTENYVPFKAELDFSASATTTGFLIFNNDNPSGLPENQKEMRIPVVIVPGGTVH